MAYIHSKGIAHLDLKTTNILLTADKRSTVVADFGISQTRVGFGSVGGNPVFWRPRQRDGDGGARKWPVGFGPVVLLRGEAV